MIAVLSFLATNFYPTITRSDYEEKSEGKISYETLQSKNTLHNTTYLETPVIVVPKSIVKPASQKTNLGANYDPDCLIYFYQCVCYAKTLTGHYGTWGNGGRKLSANSGAVKGAVIIFHNNHVGVVLEDSNGSTVVFTDRNNDLASGIRPRVEIPINDPLIWKYHKF